ncbi:MAG: MarR family transcriptional regulator [Rhodocyclaceae bacterium]|nr:MarR family transcriptional regulator [Rhodocyclaceae bacterium]
MNEEPDRRAIIAWTRLLRSHQLSLERVEKALKAADLPPLRWYDVLLELHRAGRDGLRQFEIGNAVLLSKHNVSRLLDRLEREALVVRQACDEDGRGARVFITEAGHHLLARMWPVYGAAIRASFERYFSVQELDQLATLLARLPDVGDG